MPEIYRETRYTRERDDSSSDDDKYKSTTVRRYKVTPSRVEREIDIDDDRRSRYSAHPGRTSGDLLVVDRRDERSYLPERPRSVIGISDYSPRQSTTVVERKVVERDDRDAYYYRDDRDRDRGTMKEYIERERVVDRDGDGYPDARSRTVIERQVVPADDDRGRDRGARREHIERERVVDRDGDGYADARSRTVIDRQVVPADDDFRGDRDRSRTTVYEKTKEVDRDPYWDRRSNAPWERDGREADVRIERRVEEREDRYPPPGEVERYRRETEYYEPAPAPIVIRQRAPEQRIIVQEAPAPAPVIISREAQETREVAIARRPDYRDDEREYRYRRETRDAYGDDRREEDYAVVARRRHDDRRGRYSDGESDDEYYVKRTIRREESGSPDHHHKRHLAEGALAGAGAAALLASRRGSRGELPEHRGRKVIAGAALGALGTEVVRRAKSAYDDRYGDERARSRSRGGGDEDRHSKLKTGLGIAAAALAVAGAAKYYQSTKQDKEELARGRSRHRDEYSDYSRSPSRKRSRSRSVAKAAVGTAAVAGLVQHFRNKSKARDGKSRSRSRLRTGAEIVGAGLLGAAGKKLYDRQKDKKERERERELSEEEDEYYRDHHDDRRHRSRSRSVGSRSAAARSTPYPEGRPADPELGMVEYGAHPLYSDPAPYPEHAGYGAPRGAAGYESGGEDGRRRHRSRRRRDGDESDTETEREPAKKRSRSRLRDLAAGAAAAGAAAIGIKKYQDNKKEKEQKERSRERSRHRDERERDRDRDRDGDRDRDRDYGSEDERERQRQREKEKLRHRRERDRRRYEDETDTTDDGYPYDPRRSPSPAHASGGAYYPPPAGAPYPPDAPAAPGFTAHPNVATTNLAEPQYQPYHPPEYSAPSVPPPVPGPPPNSAATTNGFPPAPLGPEHVSAASRPAGRRSPEREIAPVQRRKEDGLIAAPAPETTEHPKQVVFIPLSPKSSRTLAQHHQEIAQKPDSDTESLDLDSPTQLIPSPSSRHYPRTRRLSDPSSNRPSPSSDGEEEEEDVIELLPDRFDASGRPLDRPPISRMYSRQGDFVYRSPRGREGWNVAGQWGVAGTDNKQVEKIVEKVTSVIEGRGSVLGLLGGILSGSLLESGGETERETDDEELGMGRRRRRERRDRQRLLEDDAYDYDDGKGERRRRRRRGSE